MRQPFPNRGLAINLRQLQYFIKIVETGNMTRAAEQLFVAQPALGLQMRQLESELGVQLLSRHSRGVAPTRAGRLLYERAAEILRLVDDTRRQVIAEGRPCRENIHLGLTNGLINFLGRDLMLHARGELADIDLRLVEEMSSSLADAVERGEIHLALAYEIAERPGLLRVPVLEEELMFITASAEGLAPDAIECEQVLARPLALPTHRDGTHQLLLGVARRLAREPRIVQEVSSVAATREMVAHGDVDSIIPYASAFEDIERGRLHARRIVNPPLKRTLYLLRSERRAPFTHESPLADLLGRMVMAFAQRLGDLATPLPALARPLSESMGGKPAPAD